MPERDQDVAALVRNSLFRTLFQIIIPRLCKKVYAQDFSNHLSVIANAKNYFITMTAPELRTTYVRTTLNETKI